MLHESELNVTKMLQSGEFCFFVDKRQSVMNEKGGRLPSRSDFFACPRYVEMGGLEPPSKHRAEKLSTCLFSLWLSAVDCRETGYPQLIG